LLTACTLTGSPSKQRIVQVKAVADRELRERDPLWKDTVRGLVDAASDFFERDFGIRFTVRTVEPWPSEETTSLTSIMLDRLQQRVPLAEQDLVIGFTGQRINRYRGRGRVDRIGNCREGLGNYVVALVSKPFRYPGDDDRPELDVLLLVHELGHIFGAEHTASGTASVMTEVFGYRSEFDPKNRDLILANKFCPFAKG
jgi:hypothetical protein